MWHDLPEAYLESSEAAVTRCGVAAAVPTLFTEEFYFRRPEINSTPASGNSAVVRVARVAFDLFPFCPPLRSSASKGLCGIRERGTDGLPFSRSLSR